MYDSYNIHIYDIFYCQTGPPGSVSQPQPNSGPNTGLTNTEKQPGGSPTANNTYVPSPGSQCKTLLNCINTHNM